jgi:adenine-specific DNA-methyltransferase
MPSKGSLIPQPGEGVDEENTHNIFIEGENLEVLKLLQKSYAGRIKMIYIDPPYNTGNDFIYPDDFSEPLETYLRVTGQVDEEGRLVTTNNRSAGRYHSNWLNMMFPRLMLAKNLLRFDGNIFISIDDNEFANLKAICDEIFGSECFIGTLVRQTIEGGKQDTKSIQSIHEYLLIYAKNSDFSKLYRKSQVDFEHYDKRDEFYEDRGPYYLKPLENRGLGYIASLDYPIIAPDGSEIYPGGQHGNNGYRWVWSKEKVARALKIGLIEFVVGREKKFKVYYKTYQFVDTEGERIDRMIPYQSLFLEGFTNRQSGNELRNLFNGIRVFDYAKPSNYLKELFSLGCESNDIVLDFFAGSCSSAHAALKLSAEGRLINFIMVQLQELCDFDTEAYKAGLKSIDEIGKERIRRVINSINSEKSIQEEVLKNCDFGFRCYSLVKSNYKDTKIINANTIEQLQLELNKNEFPLIENWEAQNLMTEILLQQGFPLDSRIRVLPEYRENKVVEVSSPFLNHRLFISLDMNITSETMKTLHFHDQDILICLDNALTDEQKITLSDKTNLKVI